MAGAVVFICLLKNMPGGEIAPIGSVFFCPPCISQNIGHPAEIFDWFFVYGTRENIAEDLIGSVGEHIHDNDFVCKIKGGILCVQCLEQSGSDIQRVSEPLSALDGTILPTTDILGCPAGKTSVVPLVLLIRDYFFGFRHETNLSGCMRQVKAYFKDALMLLKFAFNYAEGRKQNSTGEGDDPA